MRIALLSDIHGNLPALRAVLGEIRLAGVDRIIFLGDAATLGPFPRETIELLAEQCFLCILGNHDAAMLTPERAAEFQIHPSLLPALEWGCSLLSEADRAFLRSFQPTSQVDLGHDMTMLCYHGSPLSITDLVLSTTAEKTLVRFFDGQSADFLAGGHTHIPMFRHRNKQIILNPGSVGNAFLEPFLPGGQTPTLLPWAEYALLGVEKNQFSVDLRRVQYDVTEVQRAVIERGLPLQERWVSSK